MPRENQASLTLRMHPARLNSLEVQSSRVKRSAGASRSRRVAGSSKAMASGRAMVGGKRAEERGMVMLIVLFLLLIATATATFAAHSASVEVRTIGYSKMALQTEYVAQGALTSGVSLIECIGVPAVHFASARNTGLSASSRLSMEEPTLGAVRSQYRVTKADIARYRTGQSAGSCQVMGPPLVTATEPVVAPGDGSEKDEYSPSLGSRMGYRADFVVDVNDGYIFTGNIPGQRSDGQSMMRYWAAVYSARGRLSPSDATNTISLRNGSATRPYLETAVNARAIGITGPFGRL